MSGDLGEYWKTIYRGRAFHLQAVAREPRGPAIQQVEATVQGLGGDILDFKMFSNLSLNPIVELGGQGLLGLLDDVAALGWGTPRSSPAATPSSREPPSGSRETIQVTFPEGDGALVIPTPAVPG